MTADELALARRVIAASVWKETHFAGNFHAWALRKNAVNVVEWDQFREMLTGESSRIHRFKGKGYTVLDVDGYRYWHMGDNRLINRALNGDPRNADTDPQA